MKRAVVFLISLIALASAPLARANMIEISSGGSYDRSNYSSGNYSWTKRIGGSLGIHFSELSSLEFSFQYVVDRTKIDGLQDTTFRDRIYSMNWVQAFTDKSYMFQPYIKAGIGQLNRTGTGTYANGASPPPFVDSVTGVLGAGVRIYFTKRFAFRIEGTSYLAGGRLRTWRDNVGATFGLSLYF